MKAAKLLSLYEAGQRDFKGVNLRGQNFKGKDLSGSDFSGTDIRSANFTDAVLKGANFTEAKAGLQRRWAIGLVVIPFLSLAAIGLSVGLVGFLLALAFEDSSNLGSKIAGWISLVILAVFFISTLRQGVLPTTTTGVVAITVIGACIFLLALIIISATGPLRHPPQQGTTLIGHGFKAFSLNELSGKWPKVAETMTEAQSQNQLVNLIA